MSIYVLRDGQEYGPFTKQQIFALLRSGELLETDQARGGEGEDYEPLSDVLKRGNTLFNVVQIAERQAAAPELPRPIVPLEPARILPQEEPDSRKGGTLRIVGAFAVLALLGIAVAVRFLLPTETDTPDHVSVEQPVAALDTQQAPSPSSTPQPSLSPSKVAASRSATPQTKSKGEPTQEAVAQVKITPPIVPVSPAASEEPAPVKEEKELVSPLPKNEPPTVKTEAATTTPVQATQIFEDKTATPSRRIEFSTKTNSKNEFDPFRPFKITTPELMAILADRFSATAIQNLGQPPPPAYGFKEGSLSIETSLRNNPKVEVKYRVPLKPNGSPALNADNLVMWADWPPGMEPLVDVKEGEVTKMVPRPIAGEMDYYGRVCNFTTFQLFFHTPQEAYNDPEECYFLGGEKWVDIVFRAKAAIEKEFKLRDRKLLMVGHSIGAAFIQRVAAARPEGVGAIAVQAAPEGTLPTKQSDTAWLLSVNRGDSTKENIGALYKALHSLKANVTLGIYPPPYGIRGVNNAYYHQQSQLMVDGSRAFLKGVVERRGSSTTNDPKKWPFVRDRLSPLRILKTASADAQKIPEDRREYLPSREFVEVLQKTPAPLQELLFQDKNGRNQACFVGLPPLGKPKGVLVYAYAPHFRDIPTFIDDIYYLAGKGFLVFAPRLKSNDDTLLVSLFDLLNSTGLAKDQKVSLVCVGDYGNKVWDAVAKKVIPQPVAMSLTNFNPRDSFDEKGLPVGGGVNCPVLFVRDATRLANLTEMGEVRDELTQLNAIREYMRKSKENHKFSRTAVINNDEKQRNNVEGRSIAVTEDFITKCVEKKLSDITLPADIQ